MDVLDILARERDGYVAEPDRFHRWHCYVRYGLVSTNPLCLTWSKASSLRIMDSAILSAASAVLGSLVGGLSTFTASLLSTRRQYRTQTIVQQVARRETLYAEFIVEASKLLADSWTHQPSPDAIAGMAGLYSAIERMRLTSSDRVIGAAEQVIHDVMDAYSAPTKTFEELRAALRDGMGRDPLRHFSEACKADLRALHEI